jgi:chemotaxis protein methyltransferase CheR
VKTEPHQKVPTVARKREPDQHLKLLEQALAARFGWQTGAPWKDLLIETVKQKSEKLGLDQAAYCQMASSSEGELEVLADIIASSETRFFRDVEQFETIREKILPGLIELRHRERRLDLWSSACASGEEAYSLAIMAREALDDSWQLSLLATDLRGKLIISASQGRYPLSAIQMINSELRRKYFLEAGASGRERLYEIMPEIRRIISFRRANLYDPNFWKNLGQQFDLILCNNLLLHFNALAVKQTINRMASVLRPGGLLAVTKVEAEYVSHPRLKLDSALPGAFFKKL